MNWREIKPITDITSFKQIELDNDVYQNAVQHISAETDQFIFDCFEHCGYSRDYILTHAREFSVQLGRKKRTFCHNGEKLFDISEEPDFYDLANPSSFRLNYNINLRCDFY